MSTDGLDFSGSCPFSLATLREHNLNIAGNVKPVDLAVINRVVPQHEVNHELGDLPTWPEFLESLFAVRDSSPGKDGVTAMLKAGGSLLHQELYRTICAMWTLPASQWDSLLTTGLGVPLHKGGDRSVLDNYRTVVLLPMLSRILGRLVARRVTVYAEQLNLYSPTQYGNRRHRSVQDALFIARTTIELAAEVAHNPALQTAFPEALVVLLFDIRKAFPSVNRPAALHLYRRLGFPDTLLSVIDQLHSGTKYQMTTSEGLSDFYSLAGGLREGCSTSPCLYTLFHDHAMMDFACRAQALRDLHPEQFVELHSWCGRPLNRRMNRHLLPGPAKLAKSPWSCDVVQLLELTFADDTMVFCREAVRTQLENLLQDTLSDWGETLKGSKTQRLGIHSGDTPEGFTSSARLLGGILEVSGHYKLDDERRLTSAKKLWSRLCKQLPRFGLPDRLLGQLIQTCIVRALLYGCESRAVSGQSLRRFQNFINGIVRFVCKQRLKDMHSEQVTQQDLNLKLGLYRISTYVGMGQLSYLGHLARLPDNRIEKQLLFAWLPPEAQRASFKGATCSRHVFWKRLTELLSHSDLDCADWQHGWISLACKDGGVVWKALIRKWVTSAERVAQQDTWQARHADAARAARIQAASDRAYNELGVYRQPDGRYACGLPGCGVVQTLQGLRVHVPTCRNLSKEQTEERARQAQASSSSSGRNSAHAPQVAPTRRPPVASSSPRRRLRAKQPAPAAFVRTSAQCDNADFAACASFDVGATLKHYASLHMTRRYRGTHLHRPITLTDLPPPQIADGACKKTCRFCRRKFPSVSLRSKHSRGCPSMPFTGWLYRVRVTLLKTANCTHPCPHCGTLFPLPKSAGRHSVECQKRMLAAKLPSGLKQFFDLPSEPVG